MKFGEIVKLQEKLDVVTSAPELPDAGYLAINTYAENIEINDGEKSVYVSLNNAKVLKNYLNKIL